MRERRHHLPKLLLAAGLVAGCALAVPLVLSSHASAAPVRFGAVLLASEETTVVSPSDTAAVGTADMTIDAATGSVCVSIAATGLSGPFLMAHIHSGAPGVAGPVVVPLPAGGTTASGCVTTTTAQASAIASAPNAFYVNIHTAASPGGAARGQLTSAIYNAALSGPAEVPGPGDPDGTGSAVVAVDDTNNRACVTTQVANIVLPATGEHIHNGAVNAAGPVVVPLTAPAIASAGSCGAASAAIIAAIIAAPTNHYFNTHTTDFPGGAIRGQLSARVASVPEVIDPAPVTGPVISLVPPTTVATTTTAAPPTTAAPATTAVATTVATTVAPTTTVTTIAPTTTTLAAAEAAPAEAVEATPAFTG